LATPLVNEPSAGQLSGDAVLLPVRQFDQRIGLTRAFAEALDVARANGIATEDIASVFFTSTADLRSAFPARAARDLGWTDVPLLGATEVDKPGAPPRCIRVLLHWNTSRRQDEIVHVYLRGSDVMRVHDPPSRLASGAQVEGPGP
jgi:chorismate mutase